MCRTLPGTSARRGALFRFAQGASLPVPGGRRFHNTYAVCLTPMRRLSGRAPDSSRPKRPNPDRTSSKHRGITHPALYLARPHGASSEARSEGRSCRLVRSSHSWHEASTLYQEQVNWSFSRVGTAPSCPNSIRRLAPTAVGFFVRGLFLLIYPTRKRSRNSHPLSFFWRHGAFDTVPPPPVPFD